MDNVYQGIQIAKILRGKYQVCHQKLQLILKKLFQFSYSLIQLT